MFSILKDIWMKSAMKENQRVASGKVVEGEERRSIKSCDPHEGLVHFA